MSSASQLPHKPSFSTAFSHVASDDLLEEYRAVIDQYREAHDKEKAAFNRERELWGLERQGLRQRIQELEGAVRQFQFRSGSEAISPRDQSQVRNGGVNHFSGVKPPSRTGSTDSAGNEIWRGAGGRGDAHPSRQFSDSPKIIPHIPSIDSHLPSISESTDPLRRKSVGFNVPEPLSPKQHASIPGDSIDSNLDGISFKSSGLAPAIMGIVLTPPGESSSPLARAVSPPRSSTSNARPDIKRPVISLSSSNLKAEDLLVKDAGHTPLPRLEDYSGSSGTPIGSLAEEEKSAKEPRPSIAAVVAPRLPTERSNSYFPAVADVLDEDPALKEPLTLDQLANGKENDSFLNQLNSKLLEHQRSLGNSPTEQDGKEAGNNSSILDGAGTGSVDEPEPQLKMKKSMNFGTQFGAANCGKGLV